MRNKFIWIICCAFLLASGSVIAQNDSIDVRLESSFELGSGLNFYFNEGDYQFKIGGMIQPYFGYEQTGNLDPDYFLNSKRSYFNISGKAVKEKVSFFLQTDFSSNDPLLDAWVAFHPIQVLTISVGQKQNIGNNREMLFMENNLQFAERSGLSNVFSRTGREFGLFVDANLGSDNFRIRPQISLTSGDGINSFGTDTRDVDLGGFKYSGRLDILPLGDFKPGNERYAADLGREENIKILFGGAFSFNDGASEAVGEGHGDFILYNAIGETQLPDYSKIAADILAKYKGFSFLGEYMVTTASSLEGLQTSETGEDPLLATQIGEYLALGNAYNVQLGYVTKNGYGIDTRYSTIQSEFETNPNTVVTNFSTWSIGVSKYLKSQSLKLHAAYSATEFENEIPSRSGIDFMVQLMF